jgi:hypothetical protein
MDINEMELVVHNDLDIYRKYKKRKFKQYHHYQQSELSPLTSTHWTWKKTTAYHAKIPGPGLGQTQIGCCDYTGKWDPIPINNCISNINAYPNDKSMHIFASTDKDSILSQKWNTIDSILAGSMNYRSQLTAS